MLDPGDGERRDAFLDVVARRSTDEPLDVRFVATVRADLLDRPLEHPTLGPHVGAGAFVLSPLSPAELDEAIVLPAAPGRGAFDEGVVADLVPRPSPSPVAATAPVHARPSSTTDASTASSAGAPSTPIGGMAGAIGRRAEEVYRSLDDDGTSATPGSCSPASSRPGHGAPDTRRRAPLGELSPGTGGRRPLRRRRAARDRP